MTRPGSVHISGCTCSACTAITDPILVTVPGAGQIVVPGTGGGIQGVQGTQGRVGVQGTQGTRGAQGIQGTVGAGIQGTRGAQGIQGIQGGGVSLQDVQEAIQGSSIGTTDDLSEGVTNKYFTVGRVSYEHMQDVVNSTWTVTHNLGFKPNVTVQDSAGTIYEGEISYINLDSLTITFSAAFSGKAYLS